MMKEFIPLTFQELEEKSKELSQPKWAHEKIVETAGFVPLDIRMKRAIQEGYVARFTESDFDSSDYRLLWDNPELEILPDDDFETVMQKSANRNALLNQIKAQKVPKVSEKVDINEEEKENSAGEPPAE